MDFMRCAVLICPAILMMGALAGSAASAEPTGAHREAIEWCDIWITDGNGTTQPRVLLIGDSITRGYYDGVEADLKGKASVSRIATSKSVGDPVLLDEITLVLKQYKFDVIHFNNGLHGWDYSEEEYRRHFPELIKTLRKYAPGAKLIWGTTTPVREAGALDKISSRTDRVKERNRIAAEIVAREKIATDDLFSLVVDHEDYYSNDGTHFNGQGTAAEAAQVAASIARLLP